MKAFAALGTVKTQTMSQDSIPHNHHHLNLNYDLSEEKYKELRDASRELNVMLANSQLFLPILWNYREYYEFLSTYLRAYAENDFLFMDKWPIKLGVNSHILNVMAVIRTYLDYTETYLKRRYGKNSSEMAQFKSYCSGEYDNNVSYRFLYRLRNYAQHCGFPITNVEMGQRSKGSIYDVPIAYLRVGVSRDKILAEFDGWGPVKDDLREMDDMININLQIDAMIHSLEQINKRHSQDEARRRLPFAQRILRMLQCINYEPSQGHPVVFEIEQREQGEMPDLGSSFRLPFEIATAIVQDELECLWGSLSVTKFVEEIPLKL